MDRVAEMLGELAIAARGVIARGGDRRFDNKAAVGLDPVTHYAVLARQFDAPRIKGPLNLDARRAAGFDDVELALLSA